MTKVSTALFAAWCASWLGWVCCSSPKDALLTDAGQGNEFQTDMGDADTEDTGSILDSGDTLQDDSDGDSESNSDDGECGEEENCGEDDAGDIDIDTNVDFCGVYPCERYTQDGGFPFDNQFAPFEGNNVTPQFTVTTFANFDCPGCKEVAHTLRDLFSKSKYADAGVHYFSHYIFETNVDHVKWEIHKSAQAAHLQGVFWPVHDLFFSSDFDAEGAAVHIAVEQLGLLDMERYWRDLVAQETTDYILADKWEFDEGVGGKSLPVIYVNGYKVKPWVLVNNVLDFLLNQNAQLKFKEKNRLKMNDIVR